jgi:hypothetical protein
MTESERDRKARDFVDSILEVNRQHGVDQSSAGLGYAVAVREAAAMFRNLPDNGFAQSCEDAGRAGGRRRSR